MPVRNSEISANQWWPMNIWGGASYGPVWKRITAFDWQDVSFVLRVPQLDDRQDGYPNLFWYGKLTVTRSNNKIIYICISLSLSLYIYIYICLIKPKKKKTKYPYIYIYIYISLFSRERNSYLTRGYRPSPSWALLSHPF